MPASMAGSRGGVSVDLSNLQTALFSPLGDERGLRDVASDPPYSQRPTTVTVVINNGCQLACDHCYLQVEQLSGPILSTSEWKRVLRNIMETRPGRLCFSGKEVLLGSQGPELIDYACDLRDEIAPDTKVGLITNGLNLLKYREQILEADPDYLDISMDGVKEDHDTVRGEGAFEKALPAVDWASDHFGERFFVALTVQGQNYNRFGQAVEFFLSRGVQNVNVGFYQAQSYTSSELALSETEIELFYNHLQEWRIQAPSKNRSIFFDLDLHQRPALTSFLRSELFGPKSVRRSPEGEIYLRREAEGQPQLVFRLAPFPTGGWRSCRITPEGDYLFAEDTLDTSGYRERAIGNVREHDYEFRQLHRQALASDRFEEVLQRYKKQVRPSLESVVSSSLSSASPVTPNTPAVPA